MRAVRFGSYSIAATVAGTSSLPRLKSMMRYRRLWPPPMRREVIRPRLLRPPVRRIGAVSERSGVVFVISAKSGVTRNRRPGVFGE